MNFRSKNSLLMVALFEYLRHIFFHFFCFFFWCSSPLATLSIAWHHGTISRGLKERDERRHSVLGEQKLNKLFHLCLCKKKRSVPLSLTLFIFRNTINLEITYRNFCWILLFFLFSKFSFFSLVCALVLFFP